MGNSEALQKGVKALPVNNKHHVSFIHDSRCLQHIMLS